MASAMNLLGAAVGAIAEKAMGKATAKIDLTDNSFSAMLDRASTPTDTRTDRTERRSESFVQVRSSNKAQDSRPTEQQEVAAVADDQDTEDEVSAVASPFASLVDLLAQLKLSLEGGEAIDPALLEQVETAMQDLSALLGIDLSALEAMPTSQDGAPMVAFFQLLGEMVQPTATAEISERLAGLQDKLGALLSRLQDGDLSEELLAKAGIDLETFDADLEAAFAKLRAATVPAEPKLATAELKVPDQVLTSNASSDGEGKGEAVVSTASANVEGKGQTDTAADQDGNKDRRNDRPVEFARRDTAPPPALDASGTPAPSQPGAQETMRVDALVNPRIIQTGYQTSQQQLNLPQIAFEMARQVQEGNTRFQIRLDPPELGRIDVRLEIDKSGQVLARLTVEKSETLDLMQRDQRALQQALQQAGLDSSKTNLEFSLKQNPFGGGQQGDERSGSGHASADDDAENGDEPIPAVNLYRGALQASGLNIVA